MVTFIKPVQLGAAVAATPPPTPPRTIPRIGINIPRPVQPMTQNPAHIPQPDYATTQSAVAQLVTTVQNQTTPPPEPTAPLLQDSKVNATILEALHSLDAALEIRAPGMAQYIAIIHKNMRDDPAQVVLMSDEERGIFFRGLKQVTQQEIIATTKGKRAPKSSTSMKNISLDDI